MMRPPSSARVAARVYASAERAREVRRLSEPRESSFRDVRGDEIWQTSCPLSL